MHDANTYLNTTQAAAYLGVSKQRIAALVAAGRLGQRIAGHAVFTLAELDAYKAERAARPRGGRPRRSS